MKRLLRATSLALMIAGVLLLFERPAYGYTDPGTGLLFIQALGSTLIAAGWYLRRKFQSLFNRAAPATYTSEFRPAAEEKEDSPLP